MECPPAFVFFFCFSLVCLLVSFNFFHVRNKHSILYNGITKKVNIKNATIACLFGFSPVQFALYPSEGAAYTPRCHTHTHTKSLKLTFLGLRSHFSKVWHATESAPWHGLFGSRQLIRTPGARRRRRRADMFPAGSPGQSRGRRTSPS